MDFKIIHLITLILLFSSCVSKERPDPVSIRAQLSGIPDSLTTAYMEEITAAGTTVLDTVNLSPETGDFVFSLYPLKHESLYRIRFKNSQGYFFIFKDRPIVIKAAYDNPKGMEINGSDATAELLRFVNDLNHKRVLFQGLKDSLAAHKNLFSDSLIQIKEAEIARYQETIRESIAREINTATSPVLALFSLGILDHENISLREKGAFLRSLKERFPGNPQIREAFEKSLPSFQKEAASPESANRISHADTSRMKSETDSMQK